MRFFLLAAILFAAIVIPILYTETATADVATGNFSVALIPDTQYYCELSSGGTPAMYNQLTGWLRTHADAEKLKFAIHLGDLVQNPEIESEWRIADSAQSILHQDPQNWKVPYSVLPGNHDLSVENYYNQYFGPSRFSGQSFYGGHEGTGNNNNYCFFEGGGMDFMVLSLEYDPSAATLVWAEQVIAAHPNHRVILATHSYLDNPGKGRKPEGTFIWNNLVKSHDSIFMVVSGHVSGWNHEISTNDFGNPVIEILSDYQWEPGGLTQPPLGGDGWLNLMEFAPNDDKIYFKSYSPYLDEWRRTELHEYTLDYVMPNTLNPGDANGDGRVDGSDVTILADNWQVGVGDPGATVTWAMGDFNTDGQVDGSDVTILADNWQHGVTGILAGVPEPSTFIMGLSLVGLFWVICRQKKS